MPNPNPHHARAAKRKSRLPGDIADVQRVVWDAVVAASDIVADPGADTLVRLRAVHAVTQAAGAYLRVVEASEFEARLSALEAHQSGLAAL